MNGIYEKIREIVRRVLSKLKTLTPAKKAIIAMALISALLAYYARSNKKNNEERQTQIKESPQEVPSNRRSSNIVAYNDPDKQCKADNLPSFINVSLGWGNSLTPLSAFKQLSPPSIMVLAAGNDHPLPLSASKIRASKEIGAIVVGSMTPDGQSSAFSQQGEEVHISAPADQYMSSVDRNGNYARFGGTSGATPLVTGSLAGFEWLSGYHPTAAEAKILLKKTAIPTLTANKVPRLNGVGMLNAYKLGMVGKKLKLTCGKNIACFKEMIRKDSTYDFPENSGLLQAVNSAFPHCNSNQCSRESGKTCEDKAAVFKRLRKAAFLNPSNGELWRNIACIYDSGNFTKNARGAMSIYKATFGNVDMSLYTHCEVNEDCIHVPSCAFSRVGQVVLLPVNKSYIAECQGRILCNGKCRCGNQEFDLPTRRQNVFGSNRAYCVNSKCVSRYRTYVGRLQQPTERQPAQNEDSTVVKNINIGDAGVNEEVDTSGDTRGGGGSVQ